jgi:hypothetical protein
MTPRSVTEEMLQLSKCCCSREGMAVQSTVSLQAGAA